MNFRRPKKHKSMDSDEDDEELQKTPNLFKLLTHCTSTSCSSRTDSKFSRTSRPDNFVDEDTEYSYENSARCQDSEKTLFHPDLYVSTNDEHWTMPPEKHKYAAAAGTFCFMTTENGDTTGSLHHVHHALCATIICTSMELTVKPEIGGTLCGHLRKGSSNKSQNEIPCRKGSIS